MIGRVFMGRYEVMRLLGEGGMGKVYLARQLDLGRQVVVKVMHDHIAADPRFRDRFAREMHVMARFQHPYAVTLYDACVNDPQGSCLVMEYIRGSTLDAVLANNQGRLDPLRVSRLLRQLCEVLQAAHAEGIMHRDLKPANLMIVDADTPYELLKVMDFGLAKLLSNESFNNVTSPSTEFAVGTPGYMCPEQAQGLPVDHRGDLYSVGVMLYECLTGKLPFSGRSTMEVLLAHAREEPPPFSFVAGGLRIPPAVERVVCETLAKNPDDRPRKARDLAERFENALKEDSTTLPEPARVQVPTPATVPVRISPRSPALPKTNPVPTLPTEPRPRPASPTGNSAIHPPETVATAERTEVPSLLVHHLEAWMPQKIAEFKLRGFIQDVHGEVMESVPGRIRVRLGGRGSAYEIPGRRSFSWLGLGRRASQIDMELRLHRDDHQRDNQLHITVTLKPCVGDLGQDPSFRSVCNQIFCDLRGYLMAQTGPVAPGENAS